MKRSISEVVGDLKAELAKWSKGDNSTIGLVVEPNIQWNGKVDLLVKIQIPHREHLIDGQYSHSPVYTTATKTQTQFTIEELRELKEWLNSVDL